MISQTMSSLAIKGGPKAAADLKLPVWPEFGAEEENAVSRTLQSHRWCRLSGSEVEAFERAFAEYHEAKHAVAVSNGTVALELAVLACGIKPGDEVLVPAVTFIASASAIVTSVGAVPVFVDVDPETASIDPALLEAAITKRTKAIVGVHYGGYPIDFDRIMPIARKHNLKVIEDCAHAQGTEWRGRKVGALGDIGAFSFQESKSFTAGEGGLVLTNDDAIAEKARLYHNIGRVMGQPGYRHFALASNFRMTELQGALLRVQLKRFKEKQVRTKQERGQYLSKLLEEIGGVRPLKEDERITQRGYYFFILRYDRDEFGGVPRDRFVEALRAEGVPCDIGYGVPLYKQPAFREEEVVRWLPQSAKPWPNYEKLVLPASERFCSEEQVTFQHQLLLLDESKIQRVAEAVSKIKKHCDEL
jgi:dTDP-4-amino-4,6-dideoxygalactose transaminase